MRQPDSTEANINPLNVIQPYIPETHNSDKNGTNSLKEAVPPPTPTSRSSQVFLHQSIDFSDLFIRLLNKSSNGSTHIGYADTPTYPAPPNNIDYEECLSDPYTEHRSFQSEGLGGSEWQHVGAFGSAGTSLPPLSSPPPHTRLERN
ncbi:hypothetical protein FQN57_002459 [Myotisia sp. PD_48]|nr:hypothetical protein FQN57_002459 [Myotisia sp. PD_48]